LGHALLQRWSSARNLGSAAQRAAERERALAYVQEHAGSELAWAVLCLVQNRLAAEEEGAETREAHTALAKALGLFTEAPGPAGQARYEAAGCLWKAGAKAQARRRFGSLFEEAVKGGRLLRIDADFRAALVGAGKDGWGELLRRTARRLIERKERGAIL